ncbi:TIM barrel protein [Streptomyces prunicolor]|uniref:sugar phosphate isomerase/epimerase family protein n=1 Tax=Streptomyces prunicolor TaxID=67348 RepID=UPI00386AC546|nr:TIM barrel protein [Streptomyces prunicolor]
MPDIGLQLYTLMNVLEDRPATLARIAGLGVTAVEPFRLGRTELTRAARLAEARSLKADIDAAGLTVSSTHARLPDAEDPGWFFEEMAEAGVPIAIASTPEALPGFTRDALVSAEGVRRYADRLNALAKAAAAHDLRVGYHNHYWEWTPLDDGRYGYDVLWDALDPSIVAEVDLYWAQTAGQVPADVVARLGERVELVHVKDGPAVRGEPQVAAGQGSVALADALDAGRDTIRVHIIEADGIAEGADIFDLVAESVTWLKERQGVGSEAS